MNISSVHPNDRIYALERAAALAERHGEQRAVIEDLKTMLAEERRASLARNAAPSN